MLKALPSLFPNLHRTSSSVRVEFYDKLQREADDYDRNPTKKYDGDLNTTLIFVNFFSYSRRSQCSSSFSGDTGWFVLCSYISFHCRRSEQPRTRLPRNELHSPQDCRQCLTWECSNRRRCRFPSMEWPRSHRRPRPSHSLLEFGCFPPRRVFRHAGQAMAQPLCPG